MMYNVRSAGRTLSIPLVGTLDLGIHPGKMVVDVVLLLVRSALGWSAMRAVFVDGGPTGASMHCRNFCSSCAQPCTL
jgi:hypothetical protein